MINELDLRQINDASIVEEAELRSKGLAGSPFSSGLVIASVTASTKTILLSSGDFNEPRAQENDILVITGGAAAGIYTIDEVKGDLELTVKEDTVDATSGTVDLYYRSGAAIAGVDDTELDYQADNVQEALEAAGSNFARAASPGLMWGKGGKVTSGSWLYNFNGSIPSSLTGLPIDFDGGVAKKLLSSSQNLDTYQVQLYYHDGGGLNMTELTGAVVTVTNSRNGAVTFDPQVPIPQGKQLAAKVVSGSAKNIQVVAIIGGA
jgi:hypothetical protein